MYCAVTWLVIDSSPHTWRGPRYEFCVRIRKLGQLGWQFIAQATTYMLIVGHLKQLCVVDLTIPHHEPSNLAYDSSNRFDMWNTSIYDSGPLSLSTSWISQPNFIIFFSICGFRILGQLLNISLPHFTSFYFFNVHWFHFVLCLSGSLDVNTTLCITIPQS